MILYLTIIGASLLMIFVGNTVVSVTTSQFSVVYSLVATLTYFCFVFAIDLAVSLLVRNAPKKFYNPSAKRFAVAKWEKKFYNSIKIKEWKDKIPELGKLANFEKTRVETLQPEYLYKFACETVYAEVMHVGMAVFGWAILAIPCKATVFSFALPIAAVNFLLQIPPIMAQRYNRPKLLRAYEFTRRKLASTALKTQLSSQSEQNCLIDLPVKSTHLSSNEKSTDLPAKSTSVDSRSNDLPLVKPS